ncbi:MAG: FHA domain-containing protein, partial [Ginsengibacter sp.]
GWLVTFNKFPEGKDFKIYEGRNSIGSQSGNDIVIDFDNTISSRHLTILFRANEFLFQDELSTNGTYLNGEIKSNGILNDGDSIKISETEFLFKKAFK